MNENIICVVIVMSTLAIIVGMTLIISIVRLKYIKDTAHEAVKGIKEKTPPGRFSDDTIRKYIREEIIKMMK